MNGRADRLLDYRRLGTAPFAVVGEALGSAAVTIFRYSKPMTQYYTDREFGERPRTTEMIDKKLWGGLFSLIRVRLSDASFGYRFPDACADSPIACGCDENAFRLTLEAEIPEIEWPLRVANVPATPVVLDLLEFCAAAVGEPLQGAFHDYFRHYHLSWDRPIGLAKLVAAANLFFTRNGVAFELDPSGRARRILPDALSNSLGWARFFTGDAELDRLLEVARANILLPKLDNRRDALEKLWDAFERFKTLEPGSDKKASSDALLDRIAPAGSKLRAELGTEAKVLTTIGNNFRIRHCEVTQEQIEGAESIDWLFGRMFSFLYMALKVTNRAT